MARARQRIVDAGNDVSVSADYIEFLKPGERVRLIQQLAEQLAEEEYPVIDLTLRQFGLPWSTEWVGSTYTYVLSMLEDGKDGDLLALHEHLFGFSGAGETLGEPDFWEQGRFKLFITHVSANKQFCGELKLALEEYGICGFVAHQDIEPTREWVDEIERALGTCDALVAVLSKGFKESNWTDQEVGYCHARKILIVSVRQDLDPYGFIARYQAINGRQHRCILAAPQSNTGGRIWRSS